MKRLALRGRSGQIAFYTGVLCALSISGVCQGVIIMRILCCKFKYSKWLPKTLKIAEKLLMRLKVYKRTSIMTNFGFTLRYKSTRKRKFYCLMSLW